MFNRVAYGPLNTRLEGFADLNKLEFVVSGLFVSLTCVFGFAPRLLTSGVEYIAFRLLV